MNSSASKRNKGEMYDRLAGSDTKPYGFMTPTTGRATFLFVKPERSNKKSCHIPLKIKSKMAQRT